MKIETHSVEISKWICLCSAMLIGVNVFAGDPLSQGFILGPEETPTQRANRRAIEQRDVQQRFVAGLSRDAWRIIDHKTNRVTAYWARFSGKVLGVRAEGVYFDGSYSAQGGESYRGEFLVAHFPRKVVDGEVIEAQEYYFAMPAGIYTDGMTTVKKLEYGKVWTLPQISPSVKKVVADQKQMTNTAPSVVKKSDPR